jgi:proline iminopeptidase
VRSTIEASNVYWASHASETRKAALRCNWETLSAEKLEAMSPGDAFVAQYVADGPKYWYDLNYDASPLWQGVPVNMDLIKVFRGFFTDYTLSWDPVQLNAPVLVVMRYHDYIIPHVLWDAALPRLQNVTFHLFERSGHTPQLEEHELFDQTLLEWI